MKIARRGLIGAGLAGAAAAAFPALAESYRRIPQRPGSRVIVDNDFAGDPDGLVGLAHQLLSPRTTVPLITISGLNAGFLPSGTGAQDTVTPGIAIARETCTRLEISNAPAVAGGHEPATAQETVSDAARAIVAEAMRDDPLPLVFSCGGPLTNLAEALRLEPAIAGRMSVIWIGGGSYPAGSWEYNLSADVPAARQVIEQSAIPLSQVPQAAYRLMQVSVAEMATEMRPISAFSGWLYDRFTSPPDFFELGGSWPMGDSPGVLLTAVSAESSRYRDWPARKINEDCTYGEEIPGRTVRVYEDIDLRLTWADFIAKLRLHAGR